MKNNIFTPKIYEIIAPGFNSNNIKYHLSKINKLDDKEQYLQKQQFENEAL